MLGSGPWLCSDCCTWMVSSSATVHPWGLKPLFLECRAAVHSGVCVCVG